MKKPQVSFYCNKCHYESPKWLGKCPACHTWNSFTEEVSPQLSAHSKHRSLSWDAKDFQASRSKTLSTTLDNIETRDEEKIKTKDDEFNRVLGGGVFAGSVVLLSGEPGIGKSTILLQLALQNITFKILYISGEESKSQIKWRADRIEHKHNTDNVLFLSATSTITMFQEIKKHKPNCIIIDSIQTTYNPLIESTSGSITQIRECASEFIQFSKQTNTTIFIIGHVNKDGMIAGPKILEHMVDTVLHFEGDRYNTYRMIRTIKNRFGSTSELGIYEMKSNGLNPVTNPSHFFLNLQSESISGTAVGISMEGLRPIFIEIQALVAQSSYNTPQRTSNGVDIKRLQLLIAILEKKGNYTLSNKDIFIKVVGGFKLEDPSSDLAIMASIISAYKEVAIDNDTCFVAEVGLNGEIRPTPKMEIKIKEAEKIGFKKMVIARRNALSLETTKTSIHISKLGLIQDLEKILY